MYRLESVGMKSKGGVGKVLGTIICVGGAILLSFYHGPVVGISESSIHWKLAENSIKNRNGSNSNNNNHLINFMLGPFLLIASSVSWAVWLIIQVSIFFLLFYHYTYIHTYIYLYICMN